MVQMEGLDKYLREHPLFMDIGESDLAFITGCAKNEKFDSGEIIFHKGAVAARFYLIRHGDVAIETQSAGRMPVVIQTLHEGDILGWAWLVPPHRCGFEARAISLVRAISIDTACLYKKCEENHELGYRVFSRCAAVMAQLLGATQLQLLDVYDSTP